jgi:excisionase family DNA binding protein
VNRPLLHRPEDVAALLNVARTRVYHWIATGELSSITIGRSRRIPDEELLRFVDRLREASPTTAREDEPAEQHPELRHAQGAPPSVEVVPKQVRRRSSAQPRRSEARRADSFGYSERS